jgi:hypothetical protein
MAPDEHGTESHLKPGRGTTRRREPYKERAAQPDDRAARDCGGFLYYTTWDAEGSQTRRQVIT